MEIILECKNLFKSYSGIPALVNFNLTLYSGKIIGLLGPNGSGKTTLIKLAAGLLTPTSGEITVGGLCPGVITKSAVSYLPERTYLNVGLTVDDTVALFRDFYADFDTARAHDLFSKLGIDTSRKIKTLSKGTREKVQLILVMSRRADLYVLDEPIAGVDPAARDYILDVILSNYEPEASILISTHLIADIENILDEVIFIQNGQIRLTASVDDIREKEGKSVDALFREVFRC